MTGCVEKDFKHAQIFYARVEEIEQDRTAEAFFFFFAED